MSPSRFVLWPVRLFVYDGRYWKPTGGWAWLRRVRYVDTVWGERFHVDTHTGP